MGFFAHYLIKFGIGSVHIRIEEKIADSAGEKTEEHPADEGKLEKEDIEFFSVGHFFGKFKGTFCFNVGVLCKDIGNHAILVRFDDSGYYEKKTPKEDLQIRDEKGFYGVEIFSVFECPEKAFKTGTKSAVLHKEAVGTDNNGIFYENSPQDRKYCDDGQSNCKDGCDFGIFIKCVKIFLAFGNKREKARETVSKNSAYQRNENRKFIAKALENGFCSLFKFGIGKHKKHLLVLATF